MVVPERGAALGDGEGESDQATVFCFFSILRGGKLCNTTEPSGANTSSEKSEPKTFRTNLPFCKLVDRLVVDCII